MTKCDDPHNISNPWMVHDKNSELVKFSEIVADEKKQKENWTKMRDKPLELTQVGLHKTFNHFFYIILHLFIISASLYN